MSETPANMGLGPDSPIGSARSSRRNRNMIILSVIALAIVTGVVIMGALSGGSRSGSLSTTLNCSQVGTVEYTLDPGEELIINLESCHAFQKRALGDFMHASELQILLNSVWVDASFGAANVSGIPQIKYTAVDDGYGYAMSDQFFITEENSSDATVGTTVRIAITGPEHTATVPDSPSATVTTKGCQSLDMSIDFPGPQGYSPITSVSATVQPGDKVVEHTARGRVQSNTGMTIAGLSANTEYTIEVLVSNAEGDSEPVTVGPVKTSSGCGTSTASYLDFVFNLQPTSGGIAVVWRAEIDEFVDEYSLEVSSTGSLSGFQDLDISQATLNAATGFKEFLMTADPGEQRWIRMSVVWSNGSGLGLLGAETLIKTAIAGE